VLQRNRFYEIFITCQSTHPTGLEITVVLFVANQIMQFTFCNKMNLTFSNASVLFIFELELLQI